MAKQLDMTKMTDAELAKSLGETRAALRSVRFEAAGSRPKDTNSPRNARRTIARILTEQRARTK